MELNSRDISDLGQSFAVMEENNWRYRLVKPLIPGPFVVLQGSAGDSMQNSIDSMPILPESFQSNNQRQRLSGDNSVSSNEDDRFSDGGSPLTSEDSDDHEYHRPQRSRENSADSLSSSYVRQFNHVGLTDDNDPESTVSMNVNTTSQDIGAGEQGSNSSSSAMLSSLGASSSSSEVQRQRRVFTAISRSGTSNTRSISLSGNVPSSSAGGQEETEDESFLVVDDSSSSHTDPNPQAATRPVATRRGRRSREDREVSDSLKRWNAESREREFSLLRELELQYRVKRQMHTRPADRRQYEHWWQRDGKLAVFSTRPSVSILSESSTSRKLGIIGNLAPGSTVLANDYFSVKCSYTYEFLRIESPLEGYVLYSIDGYNFLSSGLPLTFCHPNDCLWRVICPDGAFVRGGLELNSSHITTIPYGAIVKVNRKTVNEMGLSRLRIDYIDDLGGKIEGWVSEVLNPLSGQRGPVLGVLPFPVPALYRVALPEGAVIRSGVELSSTELRIAPPGSILKVTGRAYSEHPQDWCIERLRLSGNGGWVSVRLNRPPPDDNLVVDLVGIDGSFDPDEPGKYHLYSQEEVASANSAAAAVVALNRNSMSSFGRNVDSTSRDDRSSRICKRTDERCLICLTEERNSTIVHGSTGHIACCLMCARVLKARGDRCPVCRLQIDSVIQHFWA